MFSPVGLACSVQMHKDPRTLIGGGQMMDYDVVVVGAGLAGSTASLFAARHGHSTLCLDAGIAGGQLLSISRIEDFPGFPDGVAGFELCPGLQTQAMDAGAEFGTGEVQSVVSDADRWTLRTAAGESVVARAVIVATGSTPTPLGVPGEDRLAGRGVSHCASCDGPIYREKVVVVVGAGDSALQEALELAEHVGEIVLVHRGSSLGGQHAYRQRVLDSGRISIRFETVVEEIVGTDNVTGVRLRDSRSGSTEELSADAVFPYVGSTAKTSFLADVLSLTPDGRVWTDAWMRTTARGLFAAGDVRSDSAAQAIAVAGDGATAAVAADRYLRDGEWVPGATPAEVAAG
jgi:thioredoxin reductase (NADPH)